MLKEFRDFATRGNVLDLAVGVIIGAAFGKIVNSLVNDILMPPLGLLLGNVDFSGLFLNLGSVSYPNLAAAKAANAATLNYGAFINSGLEFLIVAFAVFLLIRQVNRFLPKPAPPATTRECPACLSAIPLKARRCGHCTGEVVPA